MTTSLKLQIVSIHRSRLSPPQWVERNASRWRVRLASRSRVFRLAWRIA